MKTEISRCMGCMSEKIYSGPCEICGYTEEGETLPDCLEPKTFLNDRYVIGKVIAKGGEGVLYIAFDTKLGKTVEIKEFMPDTLCKRGEDRESVEIADGALPLFKSYLSEYADLHKTIMGELGGDGLKRSYDIFAANGTGYVVTEHIDGMTLEQHIEQNGGKLSWGEVAAMLPTLLDTVAAMHGKGMVHRGLSPETIMIRKNGNPVITGAEISAARTAGSRLTGGMFKGYAAIEQYDLSERQGSWTDVYAICAVLYRALTGIVPPDACERKNADTLVPAHRVNEDVPEYVSDAIAAGMRMNRPERVRDISTLRAMLSDAPEEPACPFPVSDSDDGPITPTVHVKFDIEEQEEQRIKAAKKKKKNKEERRNIGTAVGLIIFLSLVTALVICIIYFSEESRSIKENAITAKTLESTTVPEEEPEPEIATIPAVTAETVTSEEPALQKMVIPDFVNRFYNSTLRARYSILEFDVTEEYSDSYAEGIIMEQDIPEGTTVTEGTVIHIKVSKGAAYTLLPDYVGMKLSDYTNKLTQLGVRFTTEAEETDEVKRGYVVRCSKNVGDRVYISENESVTVYYAVKPVETTTTEEEEIPIDVPDDDNEEEEFVSDEG
ncbi:MAG: PASTA domain-containing protein [Ruminiclostridium sp.]|nr:PASTA domain-containing protein [Ruminiclostridium sp.]